MSRHIEQLENIQAQLTRIEARDKVMAAKLSAIGEAIDGITQSLRDFADAMTEAAQDVEIAVPEQSQGEILADAIAKLAAEDRSEQEEELEFPAWGAPRKQKGGA